MFSVCPPYNTVFTLEAKLNHLQPLTIGAQSSCGIMGWRPETAPSDVEMPSLGARPMGWQTAGTICPHPPPRQWHCHPLMPLWRTISSHLSLSSAPPVSAPPHSASPLRAIYRQTARLGYLFFKATDSRGVHIECNGVCCSSHHRGKNGLEECCCCLCCFLTLFRLPICAHSESSTNVDLCVNIYLCVCLCVCA